MKSDLFKLTALVFCALALLTGPLLAHDYIPGELPDHPILLKGGTIHTISNGTIENGDLLFDKGLIVELGTGLTPPDNAEIVPLNGAHLYPGLISASSGIGLVEIGAVRATRDGNEIGRVNPNVQARVAYNPDSEIIPSVRANGVACALIIPGGSLVRGQSSLMNLDGWTYEDCTEQQAVGLHISWPRTSLRSSGDENRSIEEQKEAMAKDRQDLRDLFENARAYYEAVKAGRQIDSDSRWEAMIPVFDGHRPLFIHANDYRQIVQAVSFAREQGLKMILVGGTDSWMVTDLLIANDIPVIIEGTQKSSPRLDDSHDLAYRLPGLLEKAGVRFCVSAPGASGTRNLTLQVAQAVPYGLSYENALRSITLSPAEILGVEDRLGSLEPGKSATLVVSEGEILDLLTQRVTKMFINGRPVDLDNKHKELFRKYSARKQP